MTTALITGITGMVGSHLADYLMENTDWEIVGMTRWRSPLDNLSGHMNDVNKENSRIKLTYGDLNDSFSLIRVIIFFTLRRRVSHEPLLTDL